MDESNTDVADGWVGIRTHEDVQGLLIAAAFALRTQLFPAQEIWGVIFNNPDVPVTFHETATFTSVTQPFDETFNEQLEGTLRRVQGLGKGVRLGFTCWLSTGQLSYFQ